MREIIIFIKHNAELLIRLAQAVIEQMVERRSRR